MQTVYLNGEFVPMDQARISPMDRGFLFADGVYEVIPVYQSHIFEWDAHLARLKHSLAAVSINNPFDDEHWLSLLKKIVSLHPWQDQFIYLQVTRGVQIPRDHLPQADLTPSVFIYTNPLKPVDERLLTQGIHVITLPDVRWQRCDIKAIALLPNVMAKIAAQAEQADDALLVNEQMYLTEGSASNMFMVKQNEIITPPLSQHILPGITRQVVKKVAAQHQIPLHEREIHQDELAQADELWLSSSTKELLPITRLNHQPVANGQPGPLWRRMRDGYQAYKNELIQHHSK